MELIFFVFFLPGGTSLKALAFLLVPIELISIFSNQLVYLFDFLRI